jgi:hypothetical protein
MTTTSVSRPFALAAAGNGAAASWNRAARAEQRLLQVRTVRLAWPVTLAGLTGGFAAVVVLRLIGM